MTSHSSALDLEAALGDVVGADGRRSREGFEPTGEVDSAAPVAMLDTVEGAVQVGGFDTPLFPEGFDATGVKVPTVASGIRIGVGAERRGEVFGLVDCGLAAELDGSVLDLDGELVAVDEGVGVLVVPRGALVLVDGEVVDVGGELVE